MQANPNVIALTGDLGYGGFDKIRDDFPDRFINCGASEQSMLDMACGLAIEGKIPVVYSITPFLLYRGFETIRTYINHEKLPVILIGSGRDKDYAHDGFSHDASDDKKFLALFENIISWWPNTFEEMRTELKGSIDNPAPTYINLVR
jgi:transketolase